MAKKAKKRTPSKKKKTQKTKTNRPRAKRETIKTSLGEVAAKHKITLSNIKPREQFIYIINELQKLDAAMSALRLMLGSLTVGQVQMKAGQPDQMPLFDDDTVAKAKSDLTGKPANGATTVTKKEVTAALQDVGAKQGMPKVKEILSQFSVTNISGLDEKQYPGFMAACDGTNAEKTVAQNDATSFL